MKIEELKLNLDNPRNITGEDFEKLCKSVKEFPKMMDLRPIIIDNNNMVLAGNMRLQALIALGYKEVPDNWVKKASSLTKAEKRRFIIADNVNFGEFDPEKLVEGWDREELESWGKDIVNWDVKSGFEVDTAPGSSSKEITDEQIRAAAQRLGKDKTDNKKYIEVTCPECSHDFTVEG